MGPMAWIRTHPRCVRKVAHVTPEISMCEDRSSTLLIQLVAAGARIEVRTRSGRRFVLVVGHERQPISAALALKLEREGHIRPLCQLSGKTLWISST
jgi:hypothetical protein